MAAAFINVPCTLTQPPPLSILQAAGEDTTNGVFDEAMYHYAISPGAQESHNVAACYQVLPHA